MTATRTVLVIGATRILRPAVTGLATTGADVLAVARTASDLDLLAGEVPAVVPVPCDALDVEALGAALAGHPRPAAGLCYLPGAEADVRRGLAALVDGPLVQLLPSAAAAPNAEPADVGGPVLQLGWTGDPPRWHSPDEISAAALAVLSTREDAVLGTVRPWTDRPT
jgi:hypothetical protein